MQTTTKLTTKLIRLKSIYIYKIASAIYSLILKADSHNSKENPNYILQNRQHKCTMLMLGYSNFSALLKVLVYLITCTMLMLHKSSVLISIEAILMYWSYGSLHETTANRGKHNLSHYF